MSWFLRKPKTKTPANKPEVLKAPATIVHENVDALLQLERVTDTLQKVLDDILDFHQKRGER